MKKTASAADYLNQTSLLRLIAVLALVLVVHLQRLPAWEDALICAGLGWRLLIAMRQWPLPSSWIRTGIAVLAFIGVYASYGRIYGQQPGIALLAIMAVLKLLEMRSRRDVMVTVFLMYFILLTHFLSSQEMWTAAYLLVCAAAITALLIDVNHPGEPLPLRTILVKGSRMVAVSLPLMVIFFVLFPRIPGPIWGLPTDAAEALSGMSDEMSPGDISQLSLSDRTAFRVRFLGTVPPPGQRYWRGPVFDSFDGRTWKSSPMSQTIRAPEAQLLGSPLRYEMTMEPHRGPWLFALELTDPETRPDKSFVASEFQLMKGKSVTERQLFEMTAHLSYVLQPELSALSQRINLALPAGNNPRTLELAKNLRAENDTPDKLIRAALGMFRKQRFVYTLEPPPLGRHSVDEFLFKTRRGFCEHYASSFTFLMRASGVPARVVTGYLGGERNLFGDFYTVRDSDAHAWAEVWLAGKGWVRIDPTGAVSPQRIESNLSEALDAAAGLQMGDRLDLGWIKINMRARLDWLDAQWNHWVLAYGPEVQLELLGKFGITDWTGMILALTIGTTLVLGVTGLLLLRQFAPARNREVAVKLWAQLQKRLLREGIAQRPSEGARDFAERVALESPELGPAVQRAAAAYHQLRYLEDATPALQDELSQAVKALRS